MDKKAYQYKLTLEGLTTPEGNPMSNQAVELNFTNHDDLYRILEMSKGKNLFEDLQDSVQFTIGLKLLTEVMLNNRKNPLFDELSPAIGEFMKKLKNK
jgi:hypothetical protein